MKILEEWQQLLAKISPLYSPKPGFADVVDKSRRAWQEALQEFDIIDSEMTDYVIYKIIAAERHYMALLKQAKRDGVKAWPEDLPRAVQCRDSEVGLVEKVSS